MRCIPDFPGRPRHCVWSEYVYFYVCYNFRQLLSLNSTAEVTSVSVVLVSNPGVATDRFPPQLWPCTFRKVAVILPTTNCQVHVFICCDLKFCQSPLWTDDRCSGGSLVRRLQSEVPHTVTVQRSVANEFYVSCRSAT